MGDLSMQNSGSVAGFDEWRDSYEGNIIMLHMLYEVIKSYPNIVQKLELVLDGRHVAVKN